MPTAHELELDKPASGFIDAFPLGNGWLGAMVHGHPGRERIDINVDTLWSGGPLNTITAHPDAGTLPALREAISNNDFNSAEQLAKTLQGPGFTDSYQPLGWLDWEYGDKRQGAYSRVLNLDCADSTVTYGINAGTISLSSFVSSPAGVLVLEAEGEAILDGDLTFHSKHPEVLVEAEVAKECAWLVATGRAPEHVTPNYVADENPVRYSSEEPDQSGLVSNGMGFALVALAQKTGPQSVRLIVSAASGFRGHKEKPSADFEALAAAARERVHLAAQRPTSELIDEHRRDYRRYYDQTSLELAGNDSVLNERARRTVLLFNFGRYLLISSSRPGTQPANLQGIWNTDVRPGWSCNYTTNINLQMNYWPAEATGLADMAEPLTDLILDLTKAGQPIARHYYQARGSAVHHNTDLWRFGTPVFGEPAYANWPSALAWLASHLWDRHRYNPENETARSDAFQVYVQVTQFVLDMLVTDSAGKLVVSPSTSPEHFFVLPTGGTAAVSAGASMDQELAYEALSRFIILAGQTRSPDPETKDLEGRARAALSALKLPSIGSCGDLLEWSEDHPAGEAGHRHLSHLYGLYPGQRITELGTPEEFEAARRALQLRLDAGSGYTGWSQSWVLCLAARLRDSSLAENALTTLLDELCSESLLDLHPHPEWPDGFIFQIDGNFGAVAGITEVLVQSHDGFIGLLMAPPKSWTAGKATGFRTQGGHIVDFEWRDGELIECSITTASEGPLILDIPGSEGDMVVMDGTGQKTSCRPAKGNLPGRQRIEWLAARSGQTFTLNIHSA